MNATLKGHPVVIDKRFWDGLREILLHLEGCDLDWVVTGSLGMALQGVETEVHDIDLQTDKDGAFLIESQLSSYVVSPVRFQVSERICSYLGELEVNDVTVEIMGDVQKLMQDGGWETPVKVEKYRCWVEKAGMKIPVLSLEYEARAYQSLGRNDKAKLLRKWLNKNKSG
jgi:hypothetical protein